MSNRGVRRRHLAQPGLPGSFIAAFCVLALAWAVATATATGVGVDRALGEAMFRCHYSERTTGQIVLPVLLGVNGVVGAVVVLIGLVASVWLLRREARALDALCAWLVLWRDALAQEASGRIVPGGGRPALPAPVARGWTEGLYRACCDADEALRATYRAAGREATELSAAAAQLETALGRGPTDDGVAGQLESIVQRLDHIDVIFPRDSRQDGA